VAWCWSCQWSCKLSLSIAIMGKIRYSVKITQTTHAWNPSNLALYIYILTTIVLCNFAEYL
jgi:hypothetical protein